MKSTLQSYITIKVSAKTFNIRITSYCYFPAKKKKKKNKTQQNLYFCWFICDFESKRLGYSCQFLKGAKIFVFFFISDYKKSFLGPPLIALTVLQNQSTDSQWGNLAIFLSLWFYVKSIFADFRRSKSPILTILKSSELLKRFKKQCLQSDNSKIVFT